MKLPSLVKIVSLGFVTAAAAYAAARPAATSAQALALPFEAVQTDLFSVPNSYSNSWADFDNDGHLDLAVSLGGGEVRLYRGPSAARSSALGRKWDCHKPVAAAPSSAA